MGTYLEKDLFIKEICTKIQNTSCVPQIVKLVYFDYYYQQYKDKLKGPFCVYRSGKYKMPVNW